MIIKLTDKSMVTGYYRGIPCYGDMERFIGESIGSFYRSEDREYRVVKNHLIIKYIIIYFDGGKLYKTRYGVYDRRLNSNGSYKTLEEAIRSIV